MNLLPLLLRVLLCMSLVANGAGFAQASTQMQLAHAAHSMPAEPAPLLMSSDCQETGSHGVDRKSSNGHASMAHNASTAAFNHGVAVAPYALPAVLDGVMGDNDAGAPSAGNAPCCDGQTCQCVCMQHASVAYAPALTGLRTYVRSEIPVRGNSQHAAPLLPHLIRPPIG